MNLVSKKITAIVFLAGICMIASNFVPLWRIILDAPQYPEGLKLQIFSNKIGGDVEIINGLNHYIGMKTLHAEEFPEFTFLPYLLVGFGIVAILVALFRRRTLLLLFCLSFVAFGILAMIDFWRWEYVYGHNLDPNAAIIVPGMAYQPPLIGFKQLLNFGAFSIPDIGGWLLVVAGLLILTATVLAYNLLDRFFKKTAPVSVMLISLSIFSCAPSGPEEIKINKDNCSHCKMTIADAHFGAEVITDKGKVFKFDDLRCLIDFIAENPNAVYKSKYVHDFTSNNVLIPVESAHFLQGGSIHSPMGGNTAAFKSADEAKKVQNELGAESASIQQIFK
ncbi:MAG TPA: nitrous oxide reductase accessory protein NosL [Saprospiraceae bacterium]|nr:nitrous oxide reductase accessory protein NosL [Saprospiraceae bacterium]